MSDPSLIKSGYEASLALVTQAALYIERNIAIQAVSDVSVAVFA